MNRHKIILLILVFAGFGILFAGGQREPEASSAAESPMVESVGVPSAGMEEKPAWFVEETEEYITVVDNMGVEVTIPKPVKTTIANGMGEMYATIRALKAQETIIASTEYTTRNKAFFPVISELPSISSVDQVNDERILELNPDVIFCSPSFYGMFNEVMVDEFPIIQVAFETIEDIQMLGAVLDRSEEAEEYIEWIQGYTDRIDEEVSKLREDEYRKLFIFYGGEYGMAPPPPYGTFGKENLRTSMVRRAGGKSISEDLQGEWISVDPEWIAQQDPPLIVREVYLTNNTPEMGYGVDDTSRVQGMLTNITNQPALEMTSAVKGRNVHMIYGDLFEDSWFVAIAYLAKLFHPDLFPDLDPSAMHQEFITRFQGLDFDVSKQGVFTYTMQ